jgi:HSP20 family protein
MEDLRRNIDDMLEHLRGRIRSTSQEAPIESFIEEGKLIVRAELPGVDPKEIAVNVVGDVLTISASREEERETKKHDFRTP